MDRVPKRRTFVLSPVDGEGPELRLTVESTDMALLIRPEGYGDHVSDDGHGFPILVENRGGVPFVVLWDDINREDASHVLSMKGAEERSRR